MWADIKNIYILFTLYILISFGLLVLLMTTKKLRIIILAEYHLDLNYLVKLLFL